MNRCGSADVKGKYELACQRFYRVADGIGRNRGDFAPARKQAKLVNRYVNVRAVSLQRCDRAKEFARRNMAVGYSFYGAERDKVREVIKLRAPAGFWYDEPKTVPVTQATRIDAHNSADFVLRKTLWQSFFPQRGCQRRPIRRKTLAKIIHPLSMAAPSSYLQRSRIPLMK